MNRQTELRIAFGGLIITALLAVPYFASFATERTNVDYDPTLRLIEDDSLNALQKTSVEDSPEKIAEYEKIGDLNTYPSELRIDLNDGSLSHVDFRTVPDSTIRPDLVDEIVLGKNSDAYLVAVATDNGGVESYVLKNDSFLAKYTFEKATNGSFFTVSRLKTVK